MAKNLSYVTAVFLITSCAFIFPANAQFRTDRPTFFQDGFEQMQREIDRLQRQQQQPTSQQMLEHPSQLLTIDDRELRWQKYIFRDAGFSIWMPSAIQSNETVIIDTSFGQINFNVFATHPQNQRYISAYSTPLNPPALNNPNTLFEQIKEAIIARTEYQLKDEQEISRETYSGRQLIMEKDGEIITFKIYLIGSRVYVLAASQEESSQISDDVISFFDSFRLLP